jgi:RelA/SpoT family (p)ppGpp synthetase
MNLEKLIEEVRKHHPDVSAPQLQAACELVADNQGLAGLTLDPAKAVAGAMILADMRLDPAAVVAGLLAPLTVAAKQAQQQRILETIKEQQGAEVDQLLSGVLRLGSIRWDRLEEEKAEKLRKTFIAMARDVRVVLIVLALRVQQMRDLGKGTDAPQHAKQIANETLEVFAPLANRLGIWQLKWELEDSSLRILKPNAFRQIATQLEQSRAERDSVISEVIQHLKEKLAAEGIEAKIYGRAKHIYSIYNKMKRKGVEFNQIYDASAVRVIANKLTECYAALGLVHSTWVPIPSEFDDYIAKPKTNGYQSLHTAVMGPSGRPVEVQVRTHEMHQFAEFGVAAHWAYKESRKASDKSHQKFMVLRQLMDWERGVQDNESFVESLKTDIFEDQVYVFTPGGDIVDMPLGSTPLDFAYRIHTEVGHRCRGARVNDQIQSLNYKLKTGDRIEILTTKSGTPTRDWMNPDSGYLHSGSARSKVRQWFRQQQREDAEAQGKELIDKELGRLGLEHVAIETILEHLDYEKAPDLFAAVGYGDRHPKGIGAIALRLERDRVPEQRQALPPSIPPPAKKKSTGGISLDGVDDILGKRARCCNPVPGDGVVGFVSRGRGIVIHRRDCGHVLSSREPERFVDIDWGPARDDRHAVDIEILAHDRPGLLRDVTNLITKSGVNMLGARAERQRDGRAWLRLSLDFRSAEELVDLLQRIDRLREVLEVRRLAG